MDKFNAMKTFVQVAETESFSKAAELLSLSKASVSKQVSELEASLDAQLFIRTTRQVRLTDNGQYYLSKCRDLLAELADVEAVFNQGDAAIHGVLRIAAPQTFSELYLGPALDQFLSLHPEIEISLTLQDRFTDLVEQRIDVGIRISELADSTLIGRRIASTSIVACASPRYLAEHGSPASPQDLREHRLILDSNFREPGRWYFDDNGQPVSVKVGGRFRVNNAILARDMAIRDGGTTMLPAFVVREAVKNGCLQIILDRFQGEPRGIYALYPQQRHVSNRVRAFMDHLVGYFSSMTF